MRAANIAKVFKWDARALRHLAIGLAGLCASVALAAWLLMQVGERTLQSGAEQIALGHAQFLRDTTPSLERLLREGVLEERTREQLLRVRRLGEVFRFKLFAADGRPLLVSDHLDKADPVAATFATLPGALAGERAYDAPADALRGHSVVEIRSGSGQADRPAVYFEAYIPLLDQGRVIGVVEVYLDHSARRARMRTAMWQASAIVGGLLGLIGGGFALYALRLAAERRRSEERLRYLAERDPLCGALNRASFQRALAGVAVQRAEGGAGFAVLHVDLDRFKEVNDTYGPAAGDAVLVVAADRLRSLLQPSDLLARLGGDEFAILQSAVASADDVLGLAQRVVEAIALPFEVLGQHIACGASVGAARFGTDARSAADLLHMADMARCRAKQGGTGHFSLYDAILDQHLDGQRQLARDLREALAKGELSLHYQPLFSADGLTLLGYEALMRWRHALRGMVPPVQFIPLAERSGQIEALGSWALQQACAEAAGWPGALTVSVNLSVAQFHGETDLVSLVERSLRASGLPAERLVLEITESLLMSDTDAVVRTLNALAAMRVQIAMDDFGTGYSSLGSLWRFPFGKVKIDRAFIKGLDSDDRVALIVRSIVSLAHSLGMRVTAEGVETVAQAAVLRYLGCDELQGYLLGRPAPAHALSHAGATLVPPERPQAPEWTELRTQPAALA